MTMMIIRKMDKTVTKSLKYLYVILKSLCKQNLSSLWEMINIIQLKA